MVSPAVGDQQAAILILIDSEGHRIIVVTQERRDDEAGTGLLVRVELSSKMRLHKSKALVAGSLGGHASPPRPGICGA